MGSLRRINSKGFKDFHQKRLDEKNFIVNQKLQEEKRILKEKKRQEEINEIAERFKYSWRDELVVPVSEEVEVQEPIVNKILKVNREKGGVVSDKFVQRVVSEGMTTSGMFQTTINPEGDVDLVPTTDNVVDSNFTTNLNWSASNGVATSADDPSRIIPGATSTVWRRADMKIPIPADKNISTVKITVSKGGGTLNWTDRDPSQNFDADLYLSVSGGTYQSVNSAESGVYTFTVDPKGSPYAPGYVFVNFGQFAKINATGQSTVQVSFQRRTPVNVFVSLDSPEATAFIRTDPIMRGLSAAERYKKLEDMLDAGNEYLLKALGLIGNKVEFADTGNIPSWEQAAGEQPEPSSPEPSSPEPSSPESSAETIKSKIPNLYKGKSGAWLTGAIGASSIERLTDDFRGTNVRVKFLKAQAQEAERASKTIAQLGRMPSSLHNEKLIQQAQDRLENAREKIKAEIEGTTPNLKPITQVPKISGDRVELEKNIEASLKQLDIDNEQLKGEALKRNIAFAADLGLDILTAVTLLSPIPGDEAAVITAQATKAGIKTGAKQVSKNAVQSTVKKNVFKNIADDAADDAARATADLLLNKARYGDDALKYVKKLDDAAASGNTDLVRRIVREIDNLDPLRRFNKPPVPKPPTKPSVGTNPGGAYPRNSPMRPATGPQGTLRNSYHPQGEVLTEKKKIKSPKEVIANKIPGYYDGKPAPLGFPMEPPAKIINGFHADLVTSDGQKKQSARYNRLDPISAKAMPPTGNPYIDKKVKSAARSYKVWKEELLLREFGTWAPIDGAGPTNSTSTTFGYFIDGSPAVNYDTGERITFTYNGLNGIENYPTSITIDQGSGEVHTTDPPPFSQIGVQGYTAKLNPRYKEAQEKYKAELKEWEAKKDANFQSIKDTLKSFGTSWEEMRESNKWVKKLSDGTVVAIVPTGSNPSPMDWTNNVRVVKLKQCSNASGPMTINYNPPNEYQDWVVENAEVQSEVYLEIGQPPKPPMEQEYLMPRRTDYKDVNPLLDLGQEYAERVGADYMMGARVQDAPEQPSFFDYDPSKMGGELAQVASTDLLSQLANAFGVGTAKRIFDYHVNWNKTKNPKPQDLTNLLSPADKKLLQDLVNKNASNANDELRQLGINAGLQHTIGLSGGLRNSLGVMDWDRGDGARIEGNTVVIRKAYDFEGFDDIGGATITTGIPAGFYALSKGVYGKTGTMNIEIRIPIVRSTRKKTQNESTTWDKLKKHRKTV